MVAMKIVQEIRNDLILNADEKNKNNFQRFFKELTAHYGVKASILHAIANKYWKEVKKKDKKEIFEICEEFLKSDYNEEAFIVSYWIPKISNLFEKEDLIVFKNWIEKYVNNWAKCDSFCNHTIGDFIEKYPNAINELKEWAKSKNKWMRRAAAVSLIIPAKKGKYLKDVFEISDILLFDKEDMVQKGYGWLLKEASRKHEQEVFNYVLKHKKNMPRTSLRYAIELMPDVLRKKAMS